MDYEAANIAANTQVIRELGIYAITASITLNAGAFGVILSKDYNKKVIKPALWLLWCGVFFAGVAILITYCYAQIALVAPPQLSVFAFLLLMVLPTFVSYTCFLVAVAIAIKKL
jgi:drug/metabolite transporter (DMT)-like permease